MLRLKLGIVALILMVSLLILRKAPASDQIQQKDRSPHQSLPTKFSIRPSHGKHQLERMLQDRPHMAQFLRDQELSVITDDDLIAKWSIEQFEGRNAKQPIYWNDGIPDQDRDSDWGGGRGGDPLTIRIAQCDKLGPYPEDRFEQAWRCLAFEFYNITSLSTLASIDAKVLDGSIDRNSFIKAYARCEWENMKRLDEFRQKVWLPWCKDRHFSTNTKIWDIPFLDNFETWYSNYKNLNDYPYSIFGPYYDSLIEWGQRLKPHPNKKP